MNDKDSSQIIDPDERRKLIQDIANIKDVLDSYKYGLNFEEFADALFQTIDRQTVAIKNLSDQMTQILERMEKLEVRLDEGIKVRVKGFSTEQLDGQDEVIIEQPPEPEEVTEEEDASHENLRAEMKDLEAKIARLFEKENELAEMSLNDPASSEEYDEKASVAKNMRQSLEERLKEIKDILGK